MTIYEEITGTDQKALLLQEDCLNCHRGFNDIKARTENFHILYELLVESGMHWWLMYGTLLGAVRDKDFIPWDCDTDIGLLKAERVKFIAFLKAAMAKGFYLIRSEANDELVSIERKGEYIDFYRWMEYKNKDYMEMCDWRIDKSFFKEIETLDFQGHKCNVPFNYIKLLERLYGDWKTPRVNFRASPFKNYAGGKTYYED